MHYVYSSGGEMSRRQEIFDACESERASNDIIDVLSNLLMKVLTYLDAVSVFGRAT